MKLLFEIILLTLMATLSVHSTILTETKTTNRDRWLSLTKELFDKIRILTDKVPSLNIIYDDTKCDAYDFKNKNKMLQICLSSFNEADKSIALEFRNPNSRFELQFSNIDITDATSDIKIDDYVAEYIDSLKDLVLDDASRKAAIDEGIQAAAQDLKIEGLEITKDGKIKYIYKNKLNIINMKITNDLLEFNTDFFQDSIDLNIPLRKFIVFETKKLIKEIIDHLYQMQRFALSDGDTASQSIKNLDCKNIFADNEGVGVFIERMTKNGLIPTLADITLTVASKDGVKSVTITCNPISVGDFTLIQLKANFGQVSTNIVDVEQTFLGKSLYNLLPVVSSFFNDLGTFIIRLIAEKNIEEQFEVANDET